MSTLLVSTNIEHHIVRMLCAAFLACAALYGVFVFSIVFDTVDRQNFEQSIQKTSSALGELESRYIAQAKNIDLSTARSHGFQDAARVKFTKKQSGLGAAIVSPVVSHNGI